MAESTRYVTLSVLFGTSNNFCIEKVLEFKAAFNAILGRPALAKFMVVPHYAYSYLKMLGPNRVITVQGYMRATVRCEKKSLDMATRDIDALEEQVMHLKVGSAEPGGITPVPKLGAKSTLTKKKT